MTIAFKPQIANFSHIKGSFSATQAFKSRAGSLERRCAPAVSTVRQVIECNRMGERGENVESVAQLDRNDIQNGVWATVRTVLIGGAVGLIFTTGIWFAGSKNDPSSESATVDTQIAVLNNQ